jgi:Tat protein secretion system quality control protein TatD with DNase activity
MPNSCAMPRAMFRSTVCWWKPTRRTGAGLHIAAKKNQPAMVRDVAEYMAVLKGVSLEQLAQQTTQNFASLFHIDPARLQPADLSIILRLVINK